MARLDRLGAAKEVLQVAAVIGGEFSYELLHAVHPIAEEELQHALHNLTDAELLYVRGIAPDASYLFKHALIRDAAYEALLVSRRKELHRLVGSTIDEKFGTFKEAYPEVLARQWTDAGETEPAVIEWSRARKAVEARCAFNEALSSYHEALDQLNRLAESAERNSRELQLRTSVYTMLWMDKGAFRFGYGRGGRTRHGAGGKERQPRVGRVVNVDCGSKRHPRLARHACNPGPC
jgi:predicted ATPase